MSNKTRLVVNKGRVWKVVKPLLMKAGVQVIGDPDKERRLFFTTSVPNLEIFLARGADVPVFVSLGLAEMGIVGKDSIMESPYQEYFEMLDFGVAKCRLIRASLENAPIVSNKVRVATKYVVSARQYYEENGIDASFIKLQGSLEIAPLAGLSDEIVDICETGNTLKANGLKEIDTIANLSARLIVNRMSFKSDIRKINDFMTMFKETIS